ncbi:hypothetical protein F506_02535 [Herbaspirillum hiltneri N3]|uniref:HEAT repeat protein n=1 Tax=Herbaspirillum hiltneri N3 TaxID=1262470 RepID=A0ABM5UWL6_9BURK|nr:hypothetical protein F506_02535 [Herbaspirillum hiltneri N3]
MKLADEVFRAPHPSLSTLDAFGEIAEDEKGNEEALRLSLLWSELAIRVPTEPQAALGLLDIANTRKSRRTRLVNELTPVLAQTAVTVASTMPPSEAWRFLQVLIEKLGETRSRLSLVSSISASTISLAQRHPVDAVEVASQVVEGGGYLLKDLATGIAKSSDAFEPAARNLAIVRGDVLLRTVLASPELAVRLLASDYGIETALAASIDGASEEEIETARKCLLPQLVSDRHAGLFAGLMADANATTIAIEAERLKNANDFTATALNDVLVDVAQQADEIVPLRGTVAEARQSQESNAMLRKLLGPNVADVRWILSVMKSSDARRSMLLVDVLTSASRQQLCAIFEAPDILDGVLKATEDLPAATEVLARLVENVRLQPADQVALVIRILTRMSGPRAGDIAVVGLEAVLSQAFLPEREQLVSTFFSHASEHIDSVRILSIGAGQEVPADLASSNLVLFDNSPPVVRNKFLRNPMALADTIVGRGAFSLSYEGGEAVGRLLWDSAPVDYHGFRLASAKLLSFLTNAKTEAASPIVAAAFPSVYRELQNESLPDFLSYMFPFMDWDRCKVARSELARAFLRSNWRPRDIALAAARAEDADRILRSIAKQDNGLWAISLIEREIDTLPEPWKRQVKKAIKNLRKYPLGYKSPSDG